MPMFSVKFLTLDLQNRRVSSFTQNEWCLLLALSKSILNHNHQFTQGGKKSSLGVGGKKESDELFPFIRQAMLKKKFLM